MARIKYFKAVKFFKFLIILFTRFLFEIFTDKDISKQKIKFLVACNKQGIKIILNKKKD